MKITLLNYHNKDWFVKTKKIDSGQKKEIIPGKEKIKGDYPVDLQKMRQRVINEIEKKFKKIEKRDYILNISFHKKTKQYVIKILDADTKEVIREMPWEKFLDMVAYMEESLKKNYKGNKNARDNLY